MLVSISVSDGRESVLAGGVWIVDMLEQRIRGCEDYVLLITACTGDFPIFFLILHLGVLCGKL